MRSWLYEDTMTFLSGATRSLGLIGLCCLTLACSAGSSDTDEADDRTGGAGGFMARSGGMAGGGGQGSTGGMGGLAGAPEAAGGVGGSDLSNSAGSDGAQAGTNGSAGRSGAGSSNMHVWFDKDMTFSGHIETETNAPDNWRAPHDYFDGELHLRLESKTAPADPHRIELCLYKMADGPPACVWLFPRLTGTGVVTRKIPRASAVLINNLAKDIILPSDFETPFPRQVFRLTESLDRKSVINDPLEANLKMVLVPKGETFPGWEAFLE